MIKRHLFYVLSYYQVTLLRNVTFLTALCKYVTVDEKQTLQLVWHRLAEAKIQKF